MTICPIAIAVGCQKCPIFKICPVNSILGDVPKAGAVNSVAPTATKPAKKTAAKATAKTTVARKKTRK